MEPPSWPVSASRLRQLFWLFTLLTIGYMIWSRSYLYPLSSGDIVQFEIAKTAARASAILQEWKNTGRYEQGLKSTTLAYFFIFLYTIAIGLGCRSIGASTGHEILIRGGKLFAWLTLVATGCDIVENIALSKTLTGDISQWNVTVAYDLARVKFSIIIVCLLFIFACSLYWLISRWEGKE